MRAALALIPAALSLLVLAAHFLRDGNLVAVLACLALLALLAVRRPWATRVLQAALLLGAAEWIVTVAALVPRRRALGEPWERMAAILAIVAAVAVLSAILFETAALRRRDGRLRAIGPTEENA